jgi:hypothetical protein
MKVVLSKAKVLKVHSEIEIHNENSEKTISINIRARVFLSSILIANCELRIANWLALRSKLLFTSLSIACTSGYCV